MRKKNYSATSLITSIDCEYSACSTCFSDSILHEKKEL